MADPVRIPPAQQPSPLQMVQREFDRVLSRFFRGREEELPGVPYGIDVREDADHFYVEAELPGYRKEDVEIRFGNGTMTIVAENRIETSSLPESDAPEASYLLHERRHQRYERTLDLPGVDEQQVHSTMQDGILTIVCNKRPDARPRKIPVH